MIMKHFFSIIALVFTCVVVLSMHSDPAYAEDSAQKSEYSPVIIDFSDDQLAYGEAVAEMNRRMEELVTGQSVPDESDGKKGEQPKAYYVVLCRTNGDSFDFSPWKPVYVIAGPYDCYTLYFTDEKTAQTAISELSDLPEIRYAEMDAEVEACGEEDPSFQSWGAESMNYGPYLSWAEGCSAGSVTVAVVDSGVYPHSMYADRMLESGHDYIDGDDDTSNDEYGHGTNVTGIIADCTQGFPVFLYPIRVLNARGGGTTGNTINGIREAINKDVDIINMSLATTNGISEAMDQAVLDAKNAGITVVAAAGNNTMDTAQVSPAHLTDEGVVIVGAVDSAGNLASYSNYGSSVDAYVYGNAIYCCSKDGGYTYATGTSMSAPHLAGLASLLILTHNGISPAEVEIRIKNSTDSSLLYNIPDLIRITPDNPGFYLTSLKMNLEDSIQLSTQIKPYTATESVTYQSSDPSVLSIEEGELIPVSHGTVTVTAQCLGLPAIVFEVQVTDEEEVTLEIPQNTIELQDEAFYGNDVVTEVILPEGLETLGTGVFEECASLKRIEIPSSVTSFGDNSFSEAVVFCEEDSTAEEYMQTNQLQYITR